MPQLPDNVEFLIEKCLESPLQLEALLRILLEPGRGWSADAVAAEIRIAPAQAVKVLATLHASRLLARSTDADAYRYAPATPELAQAAMALQRVCITDREEVLVRIMGRRRDPVRMFADAFKLGGKKGGNDAG